MKQLNFTHVSEARSFSAIAMVWLGIAIACLALLLWPHQEVRPALNFSNTGQLSSLDRQKLFEIERGAAMAAPLDSVGLINLALLAHSNGDHGVAEKFYKLAAALSVRNFSAQSEVIDALIVRGQISEALIHIDGILRAKPQQTSQVFAVLVALAQRGDGLQPLVNMLASDPPWRPNFFSFASADTAIPDTAYSIFAEMRKRHLVITDGEVRGYLKHLIDQKDIQKAYFVWLDLLNEKQLRNVKLLYDGDFTTQSQNLFFDWTPKGVPGVTITQVARVGGQGEHSLLVDFVMARPNSNMIEQYLMLPPGNFTFQGEINSKNLNAENGLQWQIRCEEKTFAAAVMESGGAGRGWENMEAEFSIPTQGCDYQKLVLRMAEPLDRVKFITGQVYFDKLRIARKS